MGFNKGTTVLATNSPDRLQEIGSCIFCRHTFKYLPVFLRHWIVCHKRKHTNRVALKSADNEAKQHI